MVHSYKASLNAMDIAYKRPHRMMDATCSSVMHSVVPSTPGNFTLTFNNNQINNQINALHSQVGARCIHRCVAGCWLHSQVCVWGCVCYIHRCVAGCVLHSQVCGGVYYIHVCGGMCATFTGV